MAAKPFLTTRWSHLAMLNYEIDPQVLQPLVPVHTELDRFNNRHYVSMVGFLYDDTRVQRVAIPGHRHFPEVNLRFYVRYRAAEGWRRGVVFVKEFVPLRAVAWIARTLYDENFVRLPMRHSVLSEGVASTGEQKVEYSWYHEREWQRLSLEVSGEAALPTVGSEEEFITEHYWGYTACRDGSTSEYLVAHPQWRVWRAATAELDCDVEALYGKEFVSALAGTPTSAFLAEGSEVAVYTGQRVF